MGPVWIVVLSCPCVTSTDSALKVIGVSIDEKAHEVVPKFVDKHDLDYQVALDTSRRPAWYAYGVAAIPAMF